ncbi:glycosyl transferase [Pseudomonas chlororaphis]|uniref:Lipid A biosynthesis (KDO)2-(Lauroyl)-lipid IVA acyltransferase n=1 Tax=Pseudomonas chlororaphis TaxID=587753 RepID=A0AAX3G0V1_9PSED|nr:glycosyl transferase [Pseudomonas chlororaphis]AZC34897.1 Lysophospholipid acyltransferase [Pseudomonas chlororaphis subsp. piscium]AZC41436.1 Lysophospholipid acyltransferase [Pseudomonas chlororaphis subsp. piscium]WDG73426.1 glycosyl transferase [Pseudomonas chlororaphis]WDH28937.1 glycosyl transferase [Pseudomonas chlororaphis]WDH71948.1 glycosyl transferase [Pseudomonas chlororaphis]
MTALPDKQDKQHWAEHKERGSFWLMKLTAFGVRVLGRRVLSPVLYIIVFYFFLFGRDARRSAWLYQQRLADWSGKAELCPSHWRVFGQFMAFADSLLDKLDVWNGKLRLEQIEIVDPARLRDQLRGARGQMLVGAHLGNLEVCRALAELGEKVTMNVLVHTKHAERFNRLLGEAGATNLRLIQVSELDPAVMLQLSQRLDRGEWLAIAGDRVPLHGGRNVRVDFLGHPAPFPQGPWLLAGLLKCPVNLLLCLKNNGRYRVFLEPFTEAVAWKRSDREQVIAQWTARYAERLGQYCLEAPQQWFNFYPFWKTDDDASA